MRQVPVVRIECNADELVAQLALLERAASASVEFRNRLAQLGELRADEFRVDCDGGAALEAGTARVCLKLPQRFLELVTAVAADGHVRVGG